MGSEPITQSDLKGIKDRLASNALDACDEAIALIEKLEATLAEVEAERDALRRSLHDETVALGCMEARAELAEAMLSRAYRAGVEAGASKVYYAECGKPEVSWMASVIIALLIVALLLLGLSLDVQATVDAVNEGTANETK